MFLLKTENEWHCPLCGETEEIESTDLMKEHKATQELMARTFPSFLGMKQWKPPKPLNWFKLYCPWCCCEWVENIKENKVILMNRREGKAKT